MATVASLFGSQAEATEAIDALADSEFADVETRVFEEVEPTAADPDVGAVPRLGSGRITGALAPGTREWFEGMDDKAIEFLMERVRSGGVLLMAKAEDERVDALESFLSEHGGKTAEHY